MQAIVLVLITITIIGLIILSRCMDEKAQRNAAIPMATSSMLAISMLMAPMSTGTGLTITMTIWAFPSPEVLFI